MASAFLRVVPVVAESKFLKADIPEIIFFYLTQIYH